MSTRLVPPGARELPALTDLRLEVRAFLAEQVAAGAFVPHVDTWLTRWDRDFTRELGRRGWLGMVIPTEYGGQGRTYLERFVVTEELLVVGAPVAAHWIAERQIGPSLLRYGTEEQKQAFLPGISRGEVVFGIGMSEPDSGSDLASVRTRAERVDGGWRLTGTKVWTSGAHEADAFFALARSAPLDPAHRHDGPEPVHRGPAGAGRARSGRSSRWVATTTSTRCTSTASSCPTTGCWARSGQGWSQVTSELGLRAQRSRARPVDLPAPRGGRTGHGRRAAAHRRRPRAARRARRGAAPDVVRRVRPRSRQHEDADTAAAVVKVLGTTVEGDIADYVDTLTASGWALDEELDTLLHAAILQRPGFTLRGGTNEILRGVIARGLGMR